MTDSDQATLVENMLLLRKEDFDELLDRVAERGAERCLAHLGLENGHAAADIRDLREVSLMHGEKRAVRPGKPRSRY